MRKLTGAFYFKKTWFGMVLYVEHTIEVHDENGSISPPRNVWDRATELDIKQLNLTPSQTSI